MAGFSGSIPSDSKEQVEQSAHFVPRIVPEDQLIWAAGSLPMSLQARKPGGQDERRRQDQDFRFAIAGVWPLRCLMFIRLMFTICVSRNRPVDCQPGRAYPIILDSSTRLGITVATFPICERHQTTSWDTTSLWNPSATVYLAFPPGKIAWNHAHSQ